MRTSFATGRGAALLKTPSHRQRTERRRLTVLCAILAVALASGVAGSLIHPQSAPTAPTAATAASPFSYFPSQ
jgi:hypothetical protein